MTISKIIITEMENRIEKFPISFNSYKKANDFIIEIDPPESGYYKTWFEIYVQEFEDGKIEFLFYKLDYNIKAYEDYPNIIEKFLVRIIKYHIEKKIWSLKQSIRNIDYLELEDYFKLKCLI